MPDITRIYLSIFLLSSFIHFSGNRRHVEETQESNFVLYICFEKLMRASSIPFFYICKGIVQNSSGDLSQQTEDKCWQNTSLVKQTAGYFLSSSCLVALFQYFGKFVATSQLNFVYKFSSIHIRLTTVIRRSSSELAHICIRVQSVQFRTN